MKKEEIGSLKRTTKSKIINWALAVIAIVFVLIAVSAFTHLDQFVQGWQSAGK
ncbi:hypothetical protein [Eupransor demetentiae]|uniref:hypothetical protein n=1 Tax=Eupransor demetentiae TaxID=3109584 RepID=UPI0032E36834